MCFPTMWLLTNVDSDEPVEPPFKAVLLWIIMVYMSCFCYAFVCVCLLMPCGHMLGKGWPLGSRL